MASDHLHPAWKVCIGLALLLFVAIATGTQVMINFGNEIEDIQAQQLAGEERGYKTRAVAGCFDIINDEEIEITEECTDPRIAAYFPPSICAKLPIVVEGCGSKAVVITGEGG